MLRVPFNSLPILRSKSSNSTAPALVLILGLSLLVPLGCGANPDALAPAALDSVAAVQTDPAAVDADAADPTAVVPTNQSPENQRPPNNPPTDFRSFDGRNNNTAHSNWGSTGIQLRRVAASAYADGISSVGGVNRPGARAISNVIADQGGVDVISERLLSAMIYAWGQFLDHDLGLTPTGGTEIMAIPVPTGDPSFDPNSTGTQAIYTTRSIFDPTTGTSTSNPRQQPNTLTAWLDASMIYGSDAVTATKLRTLSGGRLKSSPGGFLPLNNAAYFPTGALPMANDAHIVPDDQLFAAGDVRANENIELLALHTLFLREHNYWAGQIASVEASLNDESIYQRARSIVIGEIEAITFNQWLPAILGHNAMPAYPGYNSATDPNLGNEFSTAGFRFGHSLLGDDVEFLDDNGVEVADEIPLSQAFFNPGQLTAVGIDPILKYLASDPASELDNQVVNSVRNFLFGPPGAGGLDLASLNIQRGRDHGLGDYNSVRAAFGLRRVTRFADISPDPAIQAKLASLYGNVNNIDLWVGALAEGHVFGASVGTTLRTIIGDQFSRARNGDRYWYQRVFTGQVLRRIDNTTLADVLRRNTTLNNLQPNVFFFRAGISGTAFADADGDGQPSQQEPPLPNQTVELVQITDEGNEVIDSEATDNRGRFRFDVLDGIRTGNYFVQILESGPGSPPIAASRTVAITRGEQFIDRVNIAVLGI